MAKETDKNAPTATTYAEEHNEIYLHSQQMARSTMAVIDAVTQRGGFRGEELSSIGALRDQCVAVTKMSEAHFANQNQNESE